MMYYENLGLDGLFEPEDTFEGLVRYVCNEGKEVTGYLGLPYFNLVCGAPEFVVRTAKSDIGFEVSGIDVHVSGKCVWELEYSGIDLREDDEEPTQFRGLFRDPESGAGGVPIELIKADVLPGLAEYDKVRMQVAAFASYIAYYNSEEEYAEAMPKNDLGKAFLLEDGAIFPVGLLSKDDEDGKKDNALVMVKGIAKRVLNGVMKIGDQRQTTFIRCKIDTQFGELDIAHTLDQAEEATIENIGEGAVVVAMCRISGDPAIYEYENGIVKDEDHALRLVRATILGEPTERMASILKEDAVHFTETTGKEYAGREAVIERFNYVKENTDEEYFVHMATLTGNKAEEAPRYNAGKRCLVLAGDDPHNLESILFVDTDEAGDIEMIYISRDSNYTFEIDRPPERESVLDDLPFHDSYREAMMARASYHGFISSDATAEDITSEEITSKTNDSALRVMLEELPEGADISDKDPLERLFGYTFAKAIEDEYTSPLGAGEQKLLETAMKYGKQFYTDFELHTGDLTEEEYKEELAEAIRFVMCLGTYCSAEFMRMTKQEEGE